MAVVLLLGLCYQTSNLNLLCHKILYHVSSKMNNTAMNSLCKAAEGLKCIENTIIISTQKGKCDQTSVR